MTTHSSLQHDYWTSTPNCIQCGTIDAIFFSMGRFKDGECLYEYNLRYFMIVLLKLCSTKQDMNDILSTDLMLTMSYLKQHPKVYWIWNHRRWCLENVPEGPGGDTHEWKKQHWTLELRMVEKLLDADARNCKCALPLSQLTDSSRLKTNPHQFMHGITDVTYSLQCQ